MDAQEPLGRFFGHGAEINKINGEIEQERAKKGHRYTHHPDDDAIEKQREAGIPSGAQDFNHRRHVIHAHPQKEGNDIDDPPSILAHLRQYTMVSRYFHPLE